MPSRAVTALVPGAAKSRCAAVELRAAAPFDFDLVLHYLRIWPAAVLERIEGGYYRRAVRIGGRGVLLSMHSTGTPARPRLLLEVCAPALDRATVEQAAALVRRTFLLDTDPA